MFILLKFYILIQIILFKYLPVVCRKLLYNQPTPHLYLIHQIHTCHHQLYGDDVWNVTIGTTLLVSSPLERSEQGAFCRFIFTAGAGREAATNPVPEVEMVDSFSDIET